MLSSINYICYKLNTFIFVNLGPYNVELQRSNKRLCFRLTACWQPGSQPLFTNQNSTNSALWNFTKKYLELIICWGHHHCCIMQRYDLRCYLAAEWAITVQQRIYVGLCTSAVVVHGREVLWGVPALNWMLLLIEKKGNKEIVIPSAVGTRFTLGALEISVQFTEHTGS